MSTQTHIDTLCEGCGKRLRVAAEYAGKKARCPHCQQVYTVPPRSAASSAGYELHQKAPPTGESWQLKSEEGLIYGPVTKVELDGWRDAGRITHRSQLLPAGGDQWLWAAAVYPELAPAEPMSPVVSPPQRESPPATLHPFYAGGIQPHRGALVLALAVIGIFTICPLLSVIGLILGLYDLRLMKREQMDPAGRGLTMAGVVLSGLSLVVGVAAIALLLTARLILP